MQSPFLHSLRQSHYVLPVSPAFLKSASINYANPRHHVVNTDQVTQVFPASMVDGLSDENVLALFTRGFFGGAVFGPERFLLWVGRGNILPARYSGFKTPPDALTIWDKSDLPNTHLLPIGTHLFGSFQMLDKHIASTTNPSSSSEDGDGDSTSYVDYGFGSDQGIFGGCHRFQITRFGRKRTGEAEEPQIQLELQHIRCNPQKNQPSVAEYIEPFHHAYAKALFADGVRSVVCR